MGELSCHIAISRSGLTRLIDRIEAAELLRREARASGSSVKAVRAAAVMGELALDEEIANVNVRDRTRTSDRLERRASS